MGTIDHSHHDGASLKAALLAAYGHHLRHLDVPDEEKVELILAIRKIMGSFVDQAFGHDPVQQARAAIPESSGASALAQRSVLVSSSSKIAVNDIGLAKTFLSNAKARSEEEPS